MPLLLLMGGPAYGIGPFFSGDVEALIKPGPDIMSSAQATYFDSSGEVDWNSAYTYEHKIIEDASQTNVEMFKTHLAFGDTHTNLRVAANYPDCYRGQMQTATSYASFFRGSAKACTPEQEGVPGGVQPGDGVGETADPRPSTPIVLDLQGNGFAFTSLATGVEFDLDADGVAESTSWTHPRSDDAFLVLDRNADGRVSNGTELFGDRTPQPISATPNGFEALRVFDQPDAGGNGDGLISSEDLIFEKLQLWRDSNQDGVSQPSELHPLDGSRVAAIDLRYNESQRRDPHGKVLRWASRYALDRYALDGFSSDRGWRLGLVDVIFVTD